MNDGSIQGHEVVGGATKRAPPDKSVVIPAAVKAAADRANELSAQAKAARDAAPPGSNEPIGETLKIVNGQPPNGQPPNGQAPNGSMIVQNFDPNNPNPPREVQNFTPPPAAPPPQPVQPQTPQSIEEWEHSFRSLQGRLNREAEEKRVMARQLQDTQRLLAQLSVAPVTPAGGEGSGVRFGAPPPPGKLVTEKERTEFGDELLDVVARRAQEVYEPIINQVVGELNTIKRQVGGVQNTVAFDAQVKMYNDLAKEVPNWDEINNSPAFAQWLDQPDPYSGVLRRGLLTTAHNNSLTDRVIAIFKGFIAYQASFGPAYGSGPQPGNGVTHASNTPPQVDLAKFAAPGRAKPGQTQVPPEKPIFNASDIPQFYLDKTMGKFKGREAEMNAIEAALFEAGREGRIRR